MAIMNLPKLYSLGFSGGGKFMIKFEIFKGLDGWWHWHLRAINGEIICWSEGYSSKQGAIDSIDWVKRNGTYAPVYEI